MPAATASPALRTRLPPLPIARWARWIVALAAVTLIGMTLGSYYYHRRQMDSIAARHLRLVVAGPCQLQAGAATDFNLLTTRVSGGPFPAPVEWSLTTPDGKRLVDRKETTDDQGRLTMIVPADMDLPSRPGTIVALNVSAGGLEPAKVTLPLVVRPEGCLTHLQTDRDRYQPGDTVYYRSLTVSRPNLAAAHALPLAFSIINPAGVPLAGSQRVGLTDRGVGNGSFPLPIGLAMGTYTLVARSVEDSVPERRLAFEVTNAPVTKNAAKNEKHGEEKVNDVKKDGGQPKTEKADAAKTAVRIEFFPEGGALAADISNRVYFFACDGGNRPLEIHGELLNSKGAVTAKLESSPAGRGRFKFVPDAAETYHVKFALPAGAADSPQLPPASVEQNIAISVERGFLPPGAPLDLAIRAAKGTLPLIVAARAGGVAVGQQLVIVSAGEAAGGTRVSVPLDDRACGAIRVTVYDDTKDSPKIVAERFVYRQPRPINVRETEAAKPSDELRLAVTNDKGQPLAAALRVMAISEAKADSSEPGFQQPDLMHDLMLDGVPDIAALNDVNLHVADSESDAAALDMALGCQKLPQEKPSSNKRVAADAARPLVVDNLDELRAEYEAALSEYRSQRTQVVNALIMLGFFGGLALALLVTMLAVMRIVWGSQLWLPTIVALLCCGVVTAVSVDPSRMRPVEVTAVGFAPSAPLKPAGVASAAANDKPDDKLRLLAEKLAKFEGDAEQLKSDRFPLQQYTPAEAAKSGEAGKRLGWYPLLINGAEGRVTLPGVTAAAAKNLRLKIDAHADGRIDSWVLSPPK